MTEAFKETIPHLGPAKDCFTQAVESCRKVVDQLRSADETIGVHIDFLDVQNADQERALRKMEDLHLELSALEKAPV